MILVADSGSTKCDWKVIGSDGKIVLEARTQGLNPAILNSDQIFGRVQESKELFAIGNSIRKVLFYGAGCNNTTSKSTVSKALGKVFPEAELSIEEDIKAVVYGSTEPAVICIMGTGSNSCYYDGRRIYNRLPSMGYLIMDDGSGSYFGRILLRAFYFNKMPEDLKQNFSSSFELDKNVVLNRLYKVENPNAHLAQYSKFLIENRSHHFIKKIISSGIKEMFKNLLLPYHKELKTVPLHFVGSIAHFLKKEIMNEVSTRGYKIRAFVRRPINDLVIKVTYSVTS